MYKTLWGDTMQWTYDNLTSLVGKKITRGGKTGKTVYTVISIDNGAVHLTYTSFNNKRSIVE